MTPTMSSDMTLDQIGYLLDEALCCEPGQGIEITFVDKKEAKNFHLRINAIRTIEARRARCEPDRLTNPDWGKHPWGVLVVRRDGEKIWIGRMSPFVGMRENVPFSDFGSEPGPGEGGTNANPGKGA